MGDGRTATAHTDRAIRRGHDNSKSTCRGTEAAPPVNIEEKDVSHFDAIVSGCGPTGGVLANLLAANGMRVCVVEKFAQIYPLPRAIVLDWEVMRALQYCGVAHALFPSTRPHPGTDFLGVDGEIIKLFDPLPPPYALGWPATSTFIQPELEKMLRRALKLRPNVIMKLGHVLTEPRQDAVGVTATIVDVETDRSEAITADVLIGCDGANSDVRASLGFVLEDYQFDEWWVVVDAWQLCDTILPRKTTQYCWPSRPATYVVGPGNLRRWEIKMLPGEEPRDFDNPGKLRAVLANYVDVRCFDIWRSASYRFAARIGDRWANNRIFLAGDAVHQTPPFLGQGLCAGVRDAFNLAWKLIFAKRHGWSETLLSSYQIERKPHVAKIVQHAKEFGLIIGEMDEQRALERDRNLRAQLHDGRMITSRQAFIPNLTGGILGEDPLSGSLMVQPEVVCAGRTALMDDLIAMSFLYVTTGTDPQCWMNAHDAFWKRLNGERIAFVRAAEMAREGVISMQETANTFQTWADANGIKAIIVRPDRYVYAIVESESDLTKKLALLSQQLGLGFENKSAQTTD